MPDNKIALFAGSFDPLTTGHLWVIKEAAHLFEGVIVAIGTHPGKKNRYSLETRLNFIRKACSEFKNVEIQHYENKYLHTYLDECSAKYLIRGIRNEEDFHYEASWRHAMAKFNPDVTRLFLIPPRELLELSSSFVKSLLGHPGWEEVIKNFLPNSIYEDFLKAEKK
jgi:pantetheine-phosphate adenylyltransferase